LQTVYAAENRSSLRYIGSSFLTSTAERVG
jgi:hypothetical protein